MNDNIKRKVSKYFGDYPPRMYFRYNLSEKIKKEVEACLYDNVVGSIYILMRTE